VACHLKTDDDLFRRSAKHSRRTDTLIAAAVQWTERIMRKVDNVFSG
jgi:hypothetical protein